MSLSNADVAALYRNMGKVAPAEFRIGRGEDAPQTKHEKYGRIKKSIDGIVFDSSGEADAYRLLKQWEQLGIIKGLSLQPGFVLQEGFRDADGKWHRAIKYNADFTFTVIDGGPWGDIEKVVDFKGFATPAFRIKEKLFRQRWPYRQLEIWDRKKVRELSR